MKREAEISVEQLEKNVELLENQINGETTEVKKEDPKPVVEELKEEGPTTHKKVRIAMIVGYNGIDFHGS